MMATDKPPTGRQDRINERKHGPFDKMLEAVIAYKGAHTTESAASRCAIMLEAAECLNSARSHRRRGG